jgi:hypothetical protein
MLVTTNHKMSISFVLSRGIQTDWKRKTLTSAKNICTSTRATNMEFPTERLMSPSHKLSRQHRTRHRHFAEAGEGCG